MKSILLNGENHPTNSATVLNLLQELELTARGVAVAVNGEVVRRTDHAVRVLQEGDRVEVIRAVQGG